MSDGCGTIGLTTPLSCCKSLLILMAPAASLSDCNSSPPILCYTAPPFLALLVYLLVSAVTSDY